VIGVVEVLVFFKKLKLSVQTQKAAAYVCTIAAVVDEVKDMYFTLFHRLKIINFENKSGNYFVTIFRKSKKLKIGIINIKVGIIILNKRFLLILKSSYFFAISSFFNLL
jgi:hypothetical protein